MTFEFVGTMPGPWEPEIERLAAACARHPWGGEGPERVVVIEAAEGAVPAALEVWMTPEAFAEFWSIYERGNYYFGAKTITARDGKVTSLILPISDKPAFLHLLANQMVAASLRRKAIAEGATAPTEPAEVNGAALWDHYVSERARYEIGQSADADFGDFDKTDLPPEARDVEEALERLSAEAETAAPLGETAIQTWLRAVRLWASALGPADAGSPHHALEIEAFASQAFAIGTKDSWQRASQALREIWSEPDRPVAEINSIAGTEVWAPLEAALFDLWKEITADG